MSSSLPHSAAPQKLSSNLENSTIQQQRQEIQLLTAELKDRDKELSDMVAVHQKQILAWERDRQKILTLAERCNLLNSELKKRNEIIKSLTQQKFKEMSQKVTDATVRCQALEEKNQSLHCSVFELSAKAGQLQAREQELLTMLKLKDAAILETTDHVTEFTSKFRKLGSALHAAEVEKLNLNKKVQDLTLRLKELILERNKLEDDLCEKMKESNKQEEEIIQLRQENGYLRDELMLTVEKAKRMDQLLQFAKSKQARTNTELESLRQIYLKQQCDLQFLHVSLESCQELRQKHEAAAHEGSDNFNMKKDARWKPVSDLEWLESFKPINGDGSTWHGEDCSCLKTEQEMKCVSSERGDNVDLGSFHSDSICLTSTQKRDKSQTCEKFSDEDFPLEINHLSVTKPASRCCRTTTDQDTSSPMSKLQRALAEYRQMVADLELSTLLQATPHCSPNSSNADRTPELAEALHGTQLSAAEERDTFSCL